MFNFPLLLAELAFLNDNLLLQHARLYACTHAYTSNLHEYGHVGEFDASLCCNCLQRRTQLNKSIHVDLITVAKVRYCLCQRHCLHHCLSDTPNRFCPVFPCYHWRRSGNRGF